MKSKLTWFLAIVIALSTVTPLLSIPVAAQVSTPVAGTEETVAPAGDQGPGPEAVKYPATNASPTVQALTTEPPPAVGLVCASDVRTFDEPTDPGGWWWYSDRSIFDWANDGEFTYLDIHVPPGTTGWVRAASGIHVPQGDPYGKLVYRVKVQTEESSSAVRDYALIRILNKDTLILDSTYARVSNLDAGKGWIEREIPFFPAQGENITFEIYIQMDATLQTTFEIGYAFLTACGPFENAGLSVHKAKYTFSVPQLYKLHGCPLWNQDGTPYVGEVQAGSEFVCDSQTCAIPFKNPTTATVSAADTTGLPNPGPGAEQCRGETNAQSSAGTQRPVASGERVVPQGVDATKWQPRSYLPMFGGPPPHNEVILAYFPPSAIPAGATDKWAPWHFWDRGKSTESVYTTMGMTAAMSSSPTSPTQLGGFDYGPWGRLILYLTTLAYSIRDTPFNSYERWNYFVRYFQKINENFGLEYSGLLFEKPFGPCFYLHTSARPDPYWPNKFFPINAVQNPDGSISVALQAAHPKYAFWLGRVIWVRGRGVKDLEWTYKPDIDAAMEEAEKNKTQLNIAMIPLGYIMAQQLTAEAWTQTRNQLGEVIDPAYAGVYDMSVQLEGKLHPEWMGFYYIPAMPVPVIP